MLPPAYRAALADASPPTEENEAGMFWLASYKDYLTAYLPAEWEEMAEKLYSIPSPSDALMRFRSKFLGLAEEMIPDAQGRIRIPQRLMRQAGLQKSVVLVGMGRRFQIWDEERLCGEEIPDVSGELASANVHIYL